MRVSKCRHPQNQIIAAKSGGLNAKEVEGSMCRCCVNFLRFELRGAFFSAPLNEASKLKKSLKTVQLKELLQVPDCLAWNEGHGKQKE